MLPYEKAAKEATLDFPVSSPRPIPLTKIGPSIISLIILEDEVGISIIALSILISLRMTPFNGPCLFEANPDNP